MMVPPASSIAPARIAFASSIRLPSRPWISEASAQATAAAVSVMPDSQAGSP